MAELRKRLGVPARTEFKWATDGGPLHKKWNEQRQARLQMLEDALDLGISAVVVICANELMPTSWSEQEIKREMLSYLYERVSMALEGDEESGVLIADQPSGDRADETKWLAQSLELTANGTEYINPDPNRIALPVLTTRSDHVDLLQLADLVAAVTTALIAGSDHAAPYKELIYELLKKNVFGYVCGTGLKVVPDMTANPRSLRNLAYWVFGEESYAVVSARGEISLPCAAWLYADEDGMGNGKPPVSKSAPVPAVETGGDS